MGDMEISATSEVLQQPIHIINAESGNVLKYNDDSLAQPVTLLYSPHGDNAGHYDCVLESAVSVALISHNPSVSQQKVAAKRTSRKTEAELITSSPYKRKLEEWQAKQKPTKKTSKSKPNTENTEKQKARNKKTSKSKPNTENTEKQKAKNKKTSKSKPNTENTEKQKARNKKTSVSHQQEASWFCFLCRECTCEDMIQCLMCSEWVHVDCAGTTESQREYFCDVCQSK
jgi:outer membrane biosynthesis protein TonB